MFPATGTASNKNKNWDSPSKPLTALSVLRNWSVAINLNKLKNTKSTIFVALYIIRDATEMHPRCHFRSLFDAWQFSAKTCFSSFWHLTTKCYLVSTVYDAALCWGIPAMMAPYMIPYIELRMYCIPYSHLLMLTYAFIPHYQYTKVILVDITAHYT